MKQLIITEDSRQAIPLTDDYTAQYSFLIYQKKCQENFKQKVIGRLCWSRPGMSALQPTILS